MKKIKRPWEKHYRPVKLFRNDVEEIINIVKTESSENAHVYIRIGEFELDDPNQLSQIDEGRIYELSVSVEGIMVGLGRTTTYLRVDDEEDTKIRGVASKIDGILQEKKRPLSFICYSKLLVFLWCFLLVVFSVLQFSYIRPLH